MKAWEELLKNNPSVVGFNRPWPTCDFTTFMVGRSKEDVQLATIMDSASMEDAQRVLDKAKSLWESRQ